jgi:hypothetical protein
MQTVPHLLQCSNVDSALWSKLYSPSQSFKQDRSIQCCGHITWYSIHSSLYTTLFYPLVPHMHQCCISISCMSWNVTVDFCWFPETNHSALFKLTQVLILHLYMSTRNICISFHVSTFFGSSALRHCWWHRICHYGACSAISLER